MSRRFRTIICELPFLPRMKEEMEYFDDYEDDLAFLDYRSSEGDDDDYFDECDGYDDYGDYDDFYPYDRVQFRDQIRAAWRKIHRKQDEATAMFALCCGILAGVISFVALVLLIISRK